jgi:hypothetical protein
MSSLLVFNRVYRLEIVSQVMLVFSTPPCELFPLQPSLSFTSPTPPPFPKSQYSMYIQTVCNWEGVREVVELCWRLYSAEFDTRFLTRFRTCKIATPPQTKTYEGRGPQTDKHLPRRLFTAQFFLLRHLVLHSIRLSFYACAQCLVFRFGRCVQKPNSWTYNFLFLGITLRVLRLDVSAWIS